MLYYFELKYLKSAVTFADVFPRENSEKRLQTDEIHRQSRYRNQSIDGLRRAIPGRKESLNLRSSPEKRFLSPTAEETPRISRVPHIVCRTQNQEDDQDQKMPCRPEPRR